MPDEFTLTYLNLDTRVAAFAEYEGVYEVTNVFDEFGDELDEDDDSEEAVTCVIKVHEECWVTINIIAIEPATIH